MSSWKNSGSGSGLQFGARRICFVSAPKVDLLVGDQWVPGMDLEIPICLCVIGDIFFLCHVWAASFSAYGNMDS